MSNQIEELKKDLDTMIGNSSQLKAEKLYAKGWRKQSCNDCVTQNECEKAAHIENYQIDGCMDFEEMGV